MARRMTHWSLSYLSYSVDEHSKGTVRLALGLDSFCNSEYKYFNQAIQHLLQFVINLHVFIV